MPTYEHLCQSCQYEWEESYGIKQNPPTLCPECNVEGSVKRLISGGSGRGIVILTGRDLKAHIDAEGKKLARASQTDESLRANLIGEEKYHNQLLQTEHITNELVKIGKSAPKVENKKKGKVRRLDQKP